MSPARARKRRRVLVLDIGGRHVEAAFSAHGDPIRIASGRKLRPEAMLRQLEPMWEGERYDAVTIGYPGVVKEGAIVREPYNLGSGWVGFDFAKALGRPVRVMNDAAMQALGSYRKGRMLFLGLGTGLGTAMVFDGKVQPMELGHLPYKKSGTLEDYLGHAALERLGKKRWRKEVVRVVELLSAALLPDDVVLGGGNARLIRSFPPGTRAGDNRNAIIGGLRLWQEPEEWKDFVAVHP
jgi:predicted NBD/HSP70 family sugar kinase